MGPCCRGTAKEIESVVLAQVRDVLKSPTMVQATVEAVDRIGRAVDEAHTLVALRQFGAVWEQLFPEAQHRIVQLLVRRVQIADEGVGIEWHDQGWQQLAAELKHGTLGAELRLMQQELPDDWSEQRKMLAG